MCLSKVETDIETRFGSGVNERDRVPASITGAELGGNGIVLQLLLGYVPGAASSHENGTQLWGGQLKYRHAEW